MVDDELDVLLVEDNPGDARLIEEMLNDGADLLRSVDVGPSDVVGATVHHELTLSDGIDRVSESSVDVVLLDLGLPDSTGLETLSRVEGAVEFVPIVVLTGLRDEEVGIEAIQSGAQDYLVKDEVTSDLLVRSIRHSIERSRQERERARRREQLEAVNQLNRISQEVTHAVITTTTREELERAVCERLVESDAYRFAWIGETDRGSDRVVPRVAAGVEDGYLDEITITVDDGPTGRGPGGRAIRTREVQVMQNVRTDPEFEPWRQEALERGYRSSAAIPIVYDEFLYGILAIYATSPNAFSDPEVEILTRMGDVIGHAITSIERKDALVSDTVLELEFEVDGVLSDLVERTDDTDRSVTFENVVRGDQAVLVYGWAEGIDSSTFSEVITRSDEVDEVRILAPETEGTEFELVSTGLAPLIESVATHGGQVTRANIADGEFRFTVEFPPGRDKRQLVEVVERHCTGASSRAQRTIERPDRDLASSRSVFRDQLTEKQRTALETAYFAGLFDWPRKSTGEEVADRLGVTPSTFTQHLRAAERKFFASVFERDHLGDDGNG